LLAVNGRRRKKRYKKVKNIYIKPTNIKQNKSKKKKQNLPTTNEIETRTCKIRLRERMVLKREKREREQKSFSRCFPPTQGRLWAGGRVVASGLAI